MTTASISTKSDLPTIGLIGAAHCGSHFFHLVLPPLFPWLAEAFDVSFAELGLLMTLFFAVSGVGQALAGIVVDRVGAMPVLIIGKTMLATGTVLAAFAPSYAALLPIAILMGLGNSVYHPADYSILTHRIAPSRLARAYSVHTIGGTLGWAVAPLLMVGVASLTSWRVALLAAGLTGLTLAAVLFACKDRIAIPPAARRGGPAPAGARETYLSAPVLACFAFFCLLAVAFFAVLSFLPLTLHQLHGIPLALATSAVTVYMIAGAAGTLAGGVLADRTGRLQAIVVAGIVVSALLFLIMALVPLSAAPLMAMIAAVGGLSGLTTPSRDLLVRRAAPAGATGRVFGFVYSGLDLGGTITPLVIGALLDAGRPRVVLLLVAAVMALTIPTVTAIRTRPRALEATG